MRGIKSHIDISVRLRMELHLTKHLVHDEHGHGRLSLQIWYDTMDNLYRPLLIGLSTAMCSGVDHATINALKKNRKRRVYDS